MRASLTPELRGMVGPTSEQTGTERRGYHHGALKDALVDAAERLLAERGPTGFTLADAARAVGVSPAAPYRHFADRGALLDEVARRGFIRFGKAMRMAWIERGGAPALERLNAMGRAYLAFARAEPGAYAAMFGLGRKDRHAADAAGDLAFDSLLEALKATFGHDPPEPARLRTLAAQVWALSHGVASLWGGSDGMVAQTEAEALLADGVAALVRAARR